MTESKSLCPFPYHPDRVGCECEKQGRSENDECLYDSPCWTSKQAYEEDAHRDERV